MAFGGFFKIAIALPHFKPHHVGSQIVISLTLVQGYQSFAICVLLSHTVQG